MEYIAQQKINEIILLQSTWKERSQSGDSSLEVLIPAGCSKVIYYLIWLQDRVWVAQIRPSSSYPFSHDKF